MPLWGEIATGIYVGGMAVFFSVALIVAVALEHQKREAVKYMQQQLNQLEQIYENSKRR